VRTDISLDANNPTRIGTTPTIILVNAMTVHITRQRTTMINMNIHVTFTWRATKFQGHTIIGRHGQILKVLIITVT